jgi:hypothetical protein
MHNKTVFRNTLCETFTFLACDVHIETCPSHFKLSNLPSQTTGLHYEILVKKQLLVELCARNYETSNGLVNGANGIFEDFIESILKSFLWIHFHNPQIGHNTQIKNIQIYNEFPRLDKQWTPIKHKIVEIQIGSNPSHTITRIQFPIQLAAT